MDKVVEGEIVEEAVSEIDKKVNEFIEKFNKLQEEYKDFLVIQLVNKVNEEGEVNPTIKLVKLGK